MERYSHVAGRIQKLQCHTFKSIHLFLIINNDCIYYQYVIGRVIK
jgi:hypothetical protein